jgi:hypothetical protein
VTNAGTLGGFIIAMGWNWSALADDFRTFLQPAALLRLAFKSQTISIHDRRSSHSRHSTFDERL